MEQQQPQYHQLTAGDVARIRDQVRRSRFVHWPRLSLEWGVAEDTLKRVAGYGKKNGSNSAQAVSSRQ